MSGRHGVCSNVLLAGVALVATPAGQARAQGPGARFGHEIVHDPVRGQTILFGGFGEDGVPLGATWLWEANGGWTRLEDRR